MTLELGHGVRYIDEPFFTSSFYYDYFFFPVSGDGHGGDFVRYAGAVPSSSPEVRVIARRDGQRWT